MSISSTFYARFFCQYFGAKNYKAETFGFAILLPICNFLAPKFCTKNARVKHWWNWLLFAMYFQISLNMIHLSECTECVMDLDLWSKMIILGSILTTFESSSIIGGSWGSIESCLKPKIKPPSGNLACPNLWNALYIESFIGILSLKLF